jgi:hypothetical protein
MTLPKNRYACISDLKDYFKKTDLLSGLTEFEKKELRHNIGVYDYIGEDGQLTPIEITYLALLETINRNSLLIGAKYIITDFQTIYPSNVGTIRETWGLSTSLNPSPVYRLLVSAINTDKLDSRAYIIGKNWQVEYDVTQEILEDGNKTKGKIT